MDFSEYNDSQVSLLLERLRVPTLDLNRLSFAGATPLEISAYLSRLPLGNPPAQGKLLYAALREISHLRIEPRTKLAMLETLHPMVADCTSSLAKEATLNSDTFERLSLAQALHKHQLMAYKSVTVELCQETGRPLDENTLLAVAAAIHGAMSIITRLLLNCWQWYISPPEHLWFELHTMYRLASHYGVTRHAFTERQQGRETRATVSATYLKPLLLACTSPWRYTGAEIKAIFAFLDRSAHLAELASYQNESLFVINMNSDIGPVYAARVPTITRHHVRLQTQRLVQALESHSSADVVSVQFPGLSERLARNLHTYWSREIVRTDEHIPDQSPVDILIGFTALHRELSGKATLTEFLSAAEIPTSVYTRRAEFGAAETTQDDRWHDAFDAVAVGSGGATDKAIEYTTEARSDLGNKPQNLNDRLQKYSAFHVNTSARGACFDVRSVPKQLSVGELISFGQPGDLQRVQGIIRWIHVTPGLHRIIGIERLPLAAQACAACVISSNQPLSAFFAGLLLRATDDATLLEIILPSIPFKTHQHIRLVSAELPGREQPALLAELVDSTFHLSRFKLLLDR